MARSMVMLAVIIGALVTIGAIATADKRSESDMARISIAEPSPGLDIERADLQHPGEQHDFGLDISAPRIRRRLGIHIDEDAGTVAVNAFGNRVPTKTSESREAAAHFSSFQINARAVYLQGR